MRGWRERESHIIQEIDNFTASRKEFSLLLKEVADITKNPKLEQLSSCFENSGQQIKRLCHIILDYLDEKEDKRSEIPALLLAIAGVEERHTIS